jgi:hypothetical protein
MYPDYYPGTIWMNLEASGKVKGTLTAVQRLLTGFRFLTSITPEKFIYNFIKIYFFIRI